MPPGTSAPEALPAAPRYRVNAKGGVPVPVTTPDTARGEISHANPMFLPDGRHSLFWVQSATPSIQLGSLDARETTPLFASDSKPVYAGGVILFVRQGRLLAQRFDATSRRIDGEPVLVAEDIRTFVLNGRSAFAASDEVLVYRSGGSRSGRPLAWYDRAGKLVGRCLAARRRTRNSCSS